MKQFVTSIAFSVPLLVSGCQQYGTQGETEKSADSTDRSAAYQDQNQDQGSQQALGSNDTLETTKYVDDLQKRLDEMNQSIEELKAQSEQLSTEARSRWQKQFSELKKQREEFRLQLQQLRNNADEGVNPGAEKRVSDAWGSLRQAFHRAADSLQESGVDVRVDARDGVDVEVGDAVDVEVGPGGTKVDILPDNPEQGAAPEAPRSQ